jgi:hypothetical protein
MGPYFPIRLQNAAWGRFCGRDGGAPSKPQNMFPWPLPPFSPSFETTSKATPGKPALQAKTSQKLNPYKFV